MADFPPQYEAPSATADTLQSILAQKRMEARQSMLDNLTTQQTQANIANQTEAAASQKAIREADAQRFQATAAATKKKADDEDAYRSYITGEIDNPTGAFASQPANVRAALRIASKDPDLGATRTLVGDLGKPPKTDEFGPVTEYDEAKDKYSHPLNPDGTPVIGKKGEIVRRNFAPQPPQPKANVQGEMPDPTDPTGKRMIQVWLNPYDPKAAPIPISGGAKRVGQIDPNTVTKVVPDEDAKSYSSYLSVARNSQSTTQAKKMAMQSYVSSLTDPAVKKDVQDILADASMMQMPADQLVQSGVLTGDPAHVAKVAEKLKKIRGF